MIDAVRQLLESDEHLRCCFMLLCGVSTATGEPAVFYSFIAGLLEAHK